MVSLFRKPAVEPVLDGRIADLARRRTGQPSAAVETTVEEAPAAVDTRAEEAAIGEDSAQPIATLTALPPPVPAEPQFEAAIEPSTPPEPPAPVAAAPEMPPLTQFPTERKPAEPPPIVVRPVVPPPASSRPAIAQRPSAAPTAANSDSGTLDEKLVAARSQLIARLGSEIRPERRSLLSRGELAKLVDAAVQAHFVRNAINADPLARRDLVTAILQELLNPGAPDPDAAGNRRTPHKALVESAKAQIQPLVLEHMDVAAAAEMPRPAFEASMNSRLTWRR